uniref:NYN domain-containing protein n=1 Tax=Chromera velia CCMP2878 TaxID=1169474 RepID=A0A0G4HJN9_9ALVE|eukprot:Cvel_28320.t1-p1 / transcript=Cvel_28320.t1 / gene=Cvel_28320 / organism=Chromera_velia_CCMP2878 / gene_product=hypothetical protein / transcript_product=hypothetical protein / location=Cvel_scaffold3681:1531-8514(-) / protein_length=865 / sequence_SO=supercontig / SO=protein_coding / is_pseudo=false
MGGDGDGNGEPCEVEVEALLLEIGKGMGKSRKKMMRFITKVVQEEWLQTAESLRDLSDDEWASLNLPIALRKRLQAACRENGDGGEAVLQPARGRKRSETTLQGEEEMQTACPPLLSGSAPPLPSSHLTAPDPPPTRAVTPVHQTSREKISHRSATVSPAGPKELSANSGDEETERSKNATPANTLPQVQKMENEQASIVRPNLKAIPTPSPPSKQASLPPPKSTELPSAPQKSAAGTGRTPPVPPRPSPTIALSDYGTGQYVQAQRTNTVTPSESLPSRTGQRGQVRSGRVHGHQRAPDRKIPDERSKSSRHVFVSGATEKSPFPFCVVPPVPPAHLRQPVDVLIWDIENCPPPRDLERRQELPVKLAAFFRPRRAVVVWNRAQYDPPARFQKAMEDAQFVCMTVGKKGKRCEAADRLLRPEIENAKDKTVCVISGDGDFKDLYRGREQPTTVLHRHAMRRDDLLRCDPLIRPCEWRQFVSVGLRMAFSYPSPVSAPSMYFQHQLPTASPPAGLFVHVSRSLENLKETLEDSFGRGRGAVRGGGGEGYWATSLSRQVCVISAHLGYVLFESVASRDLFLSNLKSERLPLKGGDGEGERESTPSWERADRTVRLAKRAGGEGDQTTGASNAENSTEVWAFGLLAPTESTGVASLFKDFPSPSPSPSPSPEKKGKQETERVVEDSGKEEKGGSSNSAVPADRGREGRGTGYLKASTTAASPKKSPRSRMTPNLAPSPSPPQPQSLPHRPKESAAAIKSKDLLAPHLLFLAAPTGTTPPSGPPPVTKAPQAEAQRERKPPSGPPPVTKAPQAETQGEKKHPSGPPPVTKAPQAETKKKRKPPLGSTRVTRQSLFLDLSQSSDDEVFV